MRLIDADRLRKIFEDGECPCKLQYTLLGIVDVQPTAFDADKVAERLEEYLFDKYCIEGDEKIDEIVKGGGVE